MEAAQSLAALRGLLALVHGFVMLELNKQLRCGGSLEEAFAQSRRPICVVGKYRAEGREQKAKGRKERFLPSAF